MVKMILALAFIMFYSFIQNHCDTNHCVLGNSSEYFINNVKFTLAKYLEQLEMVGIVSKAQNCLVFQVNGIVDHNLPLKW